MSIESREIKDIHTLYQNLYERVDIKSLDLSKPNGGMSNDDYNALTSGQRNRIQSHIRNQKNKTDMKDAGVKPNDGPSTVSNVNPEGKAKKIDNQSTTSSSSNTTKKIPGEFPGTKKEFDAKYGSDEKKPTASGSVEVDGKKLMNNLKSDSSTTKKIPGEFPGTKKEFDSKYGSDEKVVRNRRGRVINNKGSLASTEKEKVVTKSDVGSDGLSSKNKKNTTQTVDVRNRRGRVTGTKEVRVQSQQSDGGTPIRNRRGRVVGTTKSTDAEGKSFPSTAEIRAKAKKDGGSGLSNIPSKEGNAVINKKPLNPDFGKKPVIQKDTAVKPEISARQKWLDKTKNSPAAKAGLGDDLRWKARQNHVKFQKDNNRGPFRDPNKKAGGRKFNPSNKVTSVMDMESYDAYDLVLIHLLETNQVDTIEEANYVMTEMDGKTILEIKRLMESMPSHVRDSIGRQYGTGKYKGEKYTIEDKKNVVNWYSRIKA